MSTFNPDGLGAVIRAKIDGLAAYFVRIEPGAGAVWATVTPRGDVETWSWDDLDAPAVIHEGWAPEGGPEPGIYSVVSDREGRIWVRTGTCWETREESPQPGSSCGACTHPSKSSTRGPNRRTL